MAALSHRQFLGTGVTGILIASGLPAADPPAALAHPSNPLFTLGVASGDPTHDSVELWTRLALDPLHGGGMPPVPVPVRWEVATDPRLRRVVRRGIALAWPQAAHTLHVHVEGLDPDRWYWYRFDARRRESPIGRTRTLPAPGSKPTGCVSPSCPASTSRTGFYTAYEHLAEEDLDFVVHLGDYIYEDGLGLAAGVRQHVRRRDHDARGLPEPARAYKSDPAPASRARECSRSS